MAWSEAAAQLAPEQLYIWLEGARRLAGAGVGLSPLVSYLRTVPGFAKQGGEAVLIHLVASVLSTASCADGRTTDALLSGLPNVARRLNTGDMLLAYLDLVDELVALVPRGLAPMLERAGFLAGATLGRRAASLGIARSAGHVDDPGTQEAWFRLESRDARTILRAASEGTLFSEVERRLSFYLRALWGRTIDLRAAERGPGERCGSSAKKGRRVAIGEGFIRMPQAFDVFPGQEGPTLYRAADAHAAAHLTYSTQRFPVRSLKPVQVALVSLIEDARVEELALRDMPGLRKLWQPFHVALPELHRERGVVDGAARKGTARRPLRGRQPLGDQRKNHVRREFARHGGPGREPQHRHAVGQRPGADAGPVQLQDLSCRAAVPRRQPVPVEFRRRRPGRSSTIRRRSTSQST